MPGAGPLVGGVLATSRTSSATTRVQVTPSSDHRMCAQQPPPPSLLTVHPGPPTATRRLPFEATATGSVSSDVAASAGIETVHAGGARLGTKVGATDGAADGTTEGPAGEGTTRLTRSSFWRRSTAPAAIATAPSAKSVMRTAIPTSRSAGG